MPSPAQQAFRDEYHLGVSKKPPMFAFVAENKHGIDNPVKDLNINSVVFNGYSDKETPTGTINGSNKVFTLKSKPNPAESLQLFLNGVLQSAGAVDYTLSGGTITYVSAPLTGSILVAWYRF